MKLINIHISKYTWKKHTQGVLIFSHNYMYAKYSHKGFVRSVLSSLFDRETDFPKQQSLILSCSQKFLFCIQHTNFLCICKCMFGGMNKSTVTRSLSNTYLITQTFNWVSNLLQNSAYLFSFYSQPPSPPCALPEPQVL